MPQKLLRKLNFRPAKAVAAETVAKVVEKQVASDSLDLEMMKKAEPLLAQLAKCAPFIIGRPTMVNGYCYVRRPVGGRGRCKAISKERAEMLCKRGDEARRILESISEACAEIEMARPKTERITK